jgi:hypothetical protein
MAKKTKEESWNDSEAKAYLVAAINYGEVTESMSAEQVYDMHGGIYHKYNFKKFKTNLENLRKKGETWKKSHAKAHLVTAIISGEVTESMSAEQVYNMHGGIYHKYKFKNFKTNLKNLRVKIGEEYQRVQDDYMAYSHDAALIKTLRASEPPHPVAWHRSDAKYLLIQDINQGRHKVMKPQELYWARPEYHENFDLKTFRNHIYQEVDGRAKRTWRYQKKQKRAKAPVSS